MSPSLCAAGDVNQLDRLAAVKAACSASSRRGGTFRSATRAQGAAASLPVGALMRVMTFSCATIIGPSPATTSSGMRRPDAARTVVAADVIGRRAGVDDVRDRFRRQTLDGVEHGVRPSARCRCRRASAPSGNVITRDVAAGAREHVDVLADLQHANVRGRRATTGGGGRARSLPAALRVERLERPRTQRPEPRSIPPSPGGVS